MQALIIVLIAAVVMQLSIVAASPHKIENRESVDRKRYEIFDSVVSKQNEVIVNDIVSACSIYPDVLEDYSSYLRNNADKLTGENSDLYPKLQNLLAKTINSVETLKKGRPNCTLGRELQNNFFATEILRMELKEKDDVDQIWRKHRESTADNSYELAVTKRNLKKAIIQDLKGEIQEFVQSLDDAGKEDNKDLVNWFSKFETATTPEEVSQAFNEFQDLYEVEWDRENKVGETNCRLAAQVEYKKFMKQIMSMP